MSDRRVGGDDPPKELIADLKPAPEIDWETATFFKLPGSRRYRLRVRWCSLGVWWTERACRKHGGDYYESGYPWLLRKFGWD